MGEGLGGVREEKLQLGCKCERRMKVEKKLPQAPISTDTAVSARVRAANRWHRLAFNSALTLVGSQEP